MVASRMDGRFELVAGAFSSDDAVNERTAEEWGVDPTRRYGSWRDLLTDEAGRLDAVVVLTPTPDHEEHVGAALDAGFEVICEKSLATSSHSAQLLADRARERGRFLAVTYNYSGYPMVRELRARIRDGELGRIVAVHVEMPQEGFLRLDAEGRPVQPQAWRRRDGAIPTVSLDLGTHTHHLLQFLLGTDPLEVVGIQAHHGAVSTVADYVSCIARYPEDVDVDMWFGKCALGYRNGLSVRVFGERAAAEWTQMWPEEVRLSSAFGAVQRIDRASPGTRVAGTPRYERFKAGHPAGFLEAFANLYVDLADALEEFENTGRTTSDYVFGADAAADGLRMMESITRSCTTRSWCSVPQRSVHGATR
jgi:predicted dehydrogenase